MTPDINIKHLTTPQKIAIMEQLWDSLSQTENDAVPEWHLKVLEERDQSTDYVSLEQVKKNLAANFQDKN